MALTGNPTKSDQVKEIIRCGKDPVYFINSYVKIQHPLKGTIPFNTYPFQDECLKSYEENRFNIILKSRQLGLSTVSAAYAVWLAIFHKDKNVLIIATKLPTAQNFVKKCLVAVQNLPKWLLLPKYQPSKQQIEFSNGSVIKAIPTSEDAGRSEALSLLIVDECAFIRDFDTIWTGIFPTISCLTGDTKVLTDLGWSNIDELCKGDVGTFCDAKDLNIHAKNGFESVSHTYISPKSPLKIITTSSGKKLKTTLEHPLWTMRDGTIGMIKANQLKIGDHLKLKFGTQQFGKIVDENAYISGVILSKSFIDGNEICVQNDDIQIGERLLTAGFQYNDGIFRSECQEHRLNSIPNSVWKGNRHTQSQFLRGFFDANSHIGNTIMTYSHNRELMNEIQLLLQNFGIVSKVYEYSDLKSRLSIPPIESQTNWVLELNKYGSELFKNDIGITVEKKMGKLLKLSEKYSGDERMQFILSKKLQSVVETMLRNVIDYQRTRISNHKKYSYISDLIGKLRYQVLANRILEDDFDLSEDEQTFFHEIGEESVLWDEIVSIECGDDQITYDFTVPGTHTFYQNGILGSNTGGRAILLSTPNGVGGQYYKLWVDAEAGVNNFNAIRLPWTVHPEHDQDWFVNETRGFTKKKISQEYVCDFVASGDTFLTSETLELVRQDIEVPYKKSEIDRNVWIWKDPVPGKKYIISADVSRGDARDFSAFHVIDEEKLEVVAEYMGKIPPEKLGDLLNEIGKLYCKALIAVEQNTFGYFTATKLKTIGYPHLYYHNARGDYRSYVPSEDETPGFPTNQKTRTQITTKLEELLRNRQLHVKSQRLYDQLQSFIWNGNKPMASKDAYDDLVLSLAIGTWMLDAGEGKNANVDIMYALLGSTGKIGLKQNDIPGFRKIHDMSIHSTYKNIGVAKPRQMDDVTKERPDLLIDTSWLL